MKLCPRCRRLKDATEYNKHRGKPDGLQTICRVCQREYNRYENRKVAVDRWQAKRRQENRERFAQWLSNHPCVDCGETDIVVLELDHERDKKFVISKLVSSNRNWMQILIEINKCAVRCANCHRRKTAKELGWYKAKRTQANLQNPLLNQNSQ